MSNLEKHSNMCIFLDMRSDRNESTLIDVLIYIFHGLSIIAYFILIFTINVPYHHPMLFYLGPMLLIPGFLLIFLSVITQIRNRDRKLIIHGVYGIVRHPMYLGAILCFVSFFFFVPHWLLLLISVSNSILIFLTIIKADHQCLERFGNDYASYSKRTPRINIIAGIFRHFK